MTLASPHILRVACPRGLTRNPHLFQDNLTEVKTEKFASRGLNASVKKHFIKQKFGTLDRLLRIALGLALIGAGLHGYIGVWGWTGTARHWNL